MAPPPPGAGRTAVGYLFMLLTTLGWAGAWITARLAAHDAPPLTVTVGRYVVAAAALLPVWLLLEGRRARRPTREEGRLLLGMALTGVILYTVLFLTGIRFAPASDGAILTPGLAGLFAMLLGAALTRVRPSPRALAGALLSLGGCVLVGWSVLREAGVSSLRFVGDLIFVASAVVWGVYTVINRRVSASVPAVTGILLASTMGALLLAPVALWFDGVPELATWSTAAVVNVVYLGLAATALAFVTYYGAVKLIGIERIAPAMGLVPVFAVVGAALLLDERLTALHALGGGLVVAGIALPGLRRPRAAAPVPARA